jgi:hypothetical protein
MIIKELVEGLGFKTFTSTASLDREITGLYTCDLLSWVMANGKNGNAWITVQTHSNILAVSSLLEFSCVILPDGLKPEAGVIEKAEEEGIPILGTDLNAYDIFKVLYEAGLK